MVPADCDAYMPYLDSFREMASTGQIPALPNGTFISEPLPAFGMPKATLHAHHLTPGEAVLIGDDEGCRADAVYEGDKEVTHSSGVPIHLSMFRLRRIYHIDDIPTAPNGETPMRYDEALTHLHNGARVARRTWLHGAPAEPAWLVLVPGSTITVEADRPIGKAAPELVGRKLTYEPHVDLVNPHTGRVRVYHPTPEDRAADDWHISY
ncbi:Protein of unknown function [Sinosporangium album]|uniref:Thoeris anti-defense 2-like domain-containing protein n=1 Tax=Sinosporangium album TaxID=504805 RepID=A0A1G8EK41_9ACTN|nr:hypothetical protein [Sinosporangium album]SDH70315.1 Protein of unknown function [Sinosporangium album]